MIPLCHIDAIEEGGSKELRDGEQSLIAVRKNGQLYVYLNRCPHRGIALEWQPDQFLDYERQFIQCSTHGALFRIENGLCIQGPCIGCSLQSVSIRIDDSGQLWRDRDNHSH
ncbi:Rieske (2Fe-2S) protein [Motiliproteus sediminis]|uniref:Rieske (2Fe-2S) protein n=1 Tax=Motiliproteus sediminis TaxID=1468178 RepID=UPI001AF004F5|nr:Rieske (2Fe-2S) protein [Motiliproteus sediminis]